MSRIKPWKPLIGLFKCCDSILEVLQCWGIFSKFFPVAQQDHLMSLNTLSRWMTDSTLDLINAKISI